MYESKIVVNGFKLEACHSFGWAFILLLVLLAASGSVNAALNERIAPPLEEIVKANLELDPNSAEVLLKKVSLELDGDSLATNHTYIALRLSDEEAVRDYSQIRISYNSHFTNLQLAFANVLTPDGELVPLNQDAVQIQTPQASDFYKDRKELVFSLPLLRPGSVIEFQYQLNDIKSKVPSQFFERLFLFWWQEKANRQVRVDPVKRIEFQIITPSDEPLYFRVPEGVKPFSVSEKADTIMYQLALNDMPSLQPEAGVHDAFFENYMIQLSTQDNWKSIKHWARNLVEPQLNASKEIEGLVQRIATENKTKEERVRAVYQYLQNNIRYVFAHVGRGGYLPHKASEVLANGYGDCKDQTILALVLLRSLGVEAYAALVSTASGANLNADMPFIGFNHMIVYISEQAGVPGMWFDTSGNKSIFPGFHSSLEQRPAMVLDEAEKAGLTIIPKRKDSEHGSDLKLELAVSEGDQMEVAFEIIPRGFYEEQYRSWWLYAPDRDKALRDIVASIYPSANYLHAEVLHSDSLSKAVKIVGTLVLNQDQKSNDKQISVAVGLNQILRLFEGLNHYTHPKARKHGYQVSLGHVVRLIADFKSPEGDYDAYSVMAGPNKKTPYFELNQRSHETANGYHVDIEFVFPNQYIAQDQYQHFYNELMGLEKLSPWMITFKKAQGMEKTLDPGLEVSAAGKRFDEVQGLLDKGKYKDALDEAKTLVKDYPKDAKAYYFLGLAQGYNGFYEQSNVSFSRAADLGYEL